MPRNHGPRLSQDRAAHHKQQWSVKVRPVVATIVSQERRYSAPGRNRISDSSTARTRQRTLRLGTSVAYCEGSRALPSAHHFGAGHIPPCSSVVALDRPHRRRKHRTIQQPYFPLSGHSQGARRGPLINDRCLPQFLLQANGVAAFGPFQRGNESGRMRHHPNLTIFKALSSVTVRACPQSLPI